MRIYQMQKTIPEQKEKRPEGENHHPAPQTAEIIPRTEVVSAEMQNTTLQWTSLGHHQSQSPTTAGTKQFCIVKFSLCTLTVNGRLRKAKERCFPITMQ